MTHHLKHLKRAAQLDREIRERDVPDTLGQIRGNGSAVGRSQPTGSDIGGIRRAEQPGEDS